MTTRHLQNLAKAYKALGNPTRLEIICLLLNGERNVTAINKQIEVSQPALSQHLSRLRDFGVLKSRRDQRNIYYSIVNSEWATLRDVVGSF